MLEPREKGIVLWTLRYGDEVRDADDYFGGIGTEKIDNKLLGLVTTLIEERSKPWDPKMVADPVQDKLLDIIASKKKGRKRIVKQELADELPERGNVVNIMDALRRSLTSPKKSAK